MQKAASHGVGAVTLVSALLLSVAGARAQSATTHTFAEIVPSDGKPTCTVSQATFDGWFPNGVSVDAIVTPADSVSFSDDPNCDFYIWSERMFLWLTSLTGSPTPTTRVFESQSFYDVSEPGSNGKRSLIPHPPGPKNMWLAAQAGREVLRTQAGAFVYYARQVNDVFAFFRGLVPDDPKPVFPTTQSELDAIEAFALAQAGVTIAEPEALAFEVKTAWVEASTLPNPGAYITTTATIADIDQVEIFGVEIPLWLQSGTRRNVPMAMIGMHVVGSAKGHPEMIWATFEHLDNAPNATFTYRDANDVVHTVTPENPTQPGWLLSGSGVDSSNLANFNIQNMRFDAPWIVVLNSSGGDPSHTMRMKAWGGASDFSPNPIPPLNNSTSSNTEIISINNSINAKMEAQAAGDVRNNYFMVGATWTANGQSPTAPFQTSFNVGGNGIILNNQVGTSKLANTTMETYEQGADTTWASGGQSCMSCHTDFPKALQSGIDVSHLFPDLKQAVPPKQPPPGPYQVPTLPVTLLVALGATLLGAGIFSLRRRPRIA
jgi:hypothetical protein